MSCLHCCAALGVFSHLCRLPLWRLCRGAQLPVKLLSLHWNKLSSAEMGLVPLEDLSA